MKYCKFCGAKTQSSRYYINVDNYKQQLDFCPNSNTYCGGYDNNYYELIFNNDSKFDESQPAWFVVNHVDNNTIFSTASVDQIFFHDQVSIKQNSKLITISKRMFHHFDQNRINELVNLY